VNPLRLITDLFAHLGKYTNVAALAVVFVAFTTFNMLYTANEVSKMFLKNQYAIPDQQEFKDLLTRKKQATVILNDLRSYLRSNRAHVWLFHNGERYFTQDHRLRTSATLEVLDHASPILQEAQSLLLVFFPKAIDEIINGGFLYMSYRDSTEYTVATMQFLNLTDTKYLAAVPLTLKSGLIVGMITAAWTDNSPASRSEAQEYLTRASYELAPYFDLESKEWKK